MTRKTTQPPPDVPLYLAFPREEASRKLTERMDGGTELRRRPISNAQALAEVINLLA